MCYSFCVPWIGGLSSQALGEKSDPPYLAIVRSDPVIRSRSRIKRMQRPSRLHCKYQVGVILQYEMPSIFQNLGSFIATISRLFIGRDFRITLSKTRLPPSGPEPYPVFSARIQELETNPRVREVLSKQNVAESVVPLFGEYSLCQR